MRGEITFFPPDFNDRLGRDDDLADLVVQPKRRYAALQALLHLLLKTRVGVDDVPLL